MKKLLVINGSPRPVSDTMVMTRAFMRGAELAGGIETTVYDVIRHDIAPCMGCLACWARGDGHCVRNDDMNALLEMITEADIILFSFPLYAFSMPSHLKAVIDRLMPLTKQRMRVTEGGVRHETIADFSQKRFLIISGCGFPHFEGNFDALRLMCQRAFPSCEMVCVPEAPMFNAPEARVVTEPRLKLFERAGVEYIKNGRLDEAAVKTLEAPMIPMEAYIAVVNGG